MTHICVRKLTIIGSDNGLAPAITWTNAGILLIQPLGTNFSEILIEIQTFSFKKMHLKLLSAKMASICVGLNVLMSTFHGLLSLQQNAQKSVVCKTTTIVILEHPISVNSLTPGRFECILDHVNFSDWCLRYLTKLPTCHWNLLMTSQYWSRKWLGAQVTSLSWTYDDPVQWHLSAVTRPG